MTWALKRQFLYILVLVAFFSVFGFLIVYPYFNKAPTCFDGKQNGTETGIDCGGSCTLACSNALNPVSVLWARSFKVIDGRYNAVAYLENKNQNAAIEKISYRFRFADKNNVYIGKRDGTTYVPPSGKFAVFEPAIDVGNSDPVYTTFEFTSPPVWIQVPPDTVARVHLSVSDTALDQSGSAGPRLSATLHNDSLYTVPDVNVVAILYDQDGNAVSASKTYLPQIDGNQSAALNFTWPEPFDRDPVTKEILPMYDIFAISLK